MVYIAIENGPFIVDLLTNDGGFNITVENRIFLYQGG